MVWVFGGISGGLGFQWFDAWAVWFLWWFACGLWATDVGWISGCGLVVRVCSGFVELGFAASVIWVLISEGVVLLIWFVS